MTNFVKTIFVIMDNLGTYISSKRHLTGLTKLGLSTLCNIDQGLISKYESGKRSPSEKHLNRLSEALSVPLSELRLEYLADKIAVLLQYENNPNDVLEAAETRLEYLISERSSNLNSLSDSVQKKLDIIDNLQAKWSEAKPLSGVQLHKMKEYFNVQYTFDSNRIEGNTLTLKETHLVINEGLTIGGKSLHHHLEAINHLEAIHWVYELIAGQRDVNKRSLLELHQLILKSIDSEHAGRFRQLPVRISGSAHIPPQPFLIDKLMEDFIGHYERQKRCLHPVILAAEMHERLVSIHPFIDGNGRTARLLMNFILLKNGFTIAILKGDHDSRMTYYSALEKVQVNNDPEPFYHLILDKATESLKEHINMT